MALGAEGFTVLAVLEARDMASEIYGRVSESVAKFSGSMKSAADTASAAGAKIDESILQTASGADALDVATAKVNAAQAKAAASTKAQADAERALISAQEEAAAAADGDAAATARLTAAGERLTVTAKAAQKATTALKGAQAEQAAISDLQAGAADKAASSNAGAGAKLSSLAASVGKVGLGLDVAGGLMVKSAANFQTSTTVLQTSGGETAAQMATVRQGILSLSASTGTALQPLVNGMYMVGSAGITGGAGLRVLQAAAQGAKAEGADLGTVSNALTTVLTDYGIKVKDTAAGQLAANAVMNQMIAVVSSGKTTTEALAASLSTVLPTAAAAKLGFDQVGGAMATMTAQGMSAQQAANDLSNTISSLQNPNAVASKEMAALGLNSNTVSKDLGKNGLTGTLAELTQAITAHMGPAGLVVQKAFASSAAAAKDANQMISAMPAGLQKLAKGYLDGSVTAKQWKADLQGLDPVSAHLMQQFATTADKTHQFNDLLAGGSQPAQTYNAALSKMLGGVTGMHTALMLTGPNMATFQGNVKKVGDAAKSAGSSVDGWKQIQGNFNQKLAEAKQSVEAMGITIGTALLPAVTKIADAVLKVVTPVLHWLQAHQKLAAIILGSLAGFASLVGVINLAAKGFGAVAKAAGAVKSVYDAVSGVIGKIVGLFTSNAAAADTAAASTDGLTASTEAGTVAAEASTVATEESTAATDASALSAAGAAIKTGVLKVAQLAGAAASYIAAGAATALGVAIDFATGPIGLIIIAIVALAGIFVLLWTKCAWFRDFWKAVWRDIEGAAKAVWNALKVAFTIWVNLMKTQFELVVHTAEAIWHGVVAAFEAIKNGVSTAVSDVIDFVKSHWQLLVAIFTGPIGIVTGLVIKFWSDVKHWFSDGVHGVEAAVSWFTSLPGKFLKWMTDVSQAVLRGIGDIVRFFTALPGRVVAGIGAVASLLLQKGKDIVNGLWSGIKNIWSSVTSFFTGLGKTVEGWLSDAGSWLYNIGKNIISGLWNGIQSAVGGLMSKISGIGGDIVSGFQSALSIFSPSRVMADQVGKFIPAGIAVGITDNMGVIQAAARKAGQVTVTAAKGGTGLGAGSSIPSIPIAAVHAGGATVVNNYFDLSKCQVINDQAAEQLVHKIGATVAKKMFPQGGYKLAGM